MKRLCVLVSVLFLFANGLSAQTPSRYIIRFKNKAFNSFSLSSPSLFLSNRSIQRRTRYSISLDSTDLPVTPRYLDSLRSVPNVVVLNASRWLNQVSIQTTDPAALTRIAAFSFVQSAAPLAARASANDVARKVEETFAVGTQHTSRTAADVYSYGASFNQVHIHNGEFLHNIGLRGEQMVVGILDAGFQNYLTVRSFDSARLNGQILGTHDFVANELSVNEDNAHGMQCFSTIAANIPGQFVGTAPKASFYLYRTEDAATEYPIEEHNWVCAAEKLDSAGADLLSSSLGYYDFDAPFNTSAYNHTYADMNGNITTVAIGADLAARKGILVVNAAGNEGSSPWHYIISPADGDSVLAVGAVNAAGVVAAFSSWGPSSDGQVKPDLASVGVSTVVQLAGNTIGASNGTSFAAPNLAGLATCLWQGFPELNNMQIIQALRRSGSIASAPNDRIGYGIPDVKNALLNLTQNFFTASAAVSACKATITFTSKDVASMRYDIERRKAGETFFTRIGQHFGSGSGFGTRTYTYTDTLVNTAAGAVEYRVRQIIDTATTTSFYGDTVSVNLAMACIPPPPVSSETVLSIAPNPANDLVTLRLTTPEGNPNLRIIITDMLGKIVGSYAKSKPAGTVLIPISLSHLARGKYFVTVYSGSLLIGTRELVKL